MKPMPIDGKKTLAQGQVNSSMSDALTLYTAQAQIVLDAINRDGTTRVKREYIQQKYGDQAWVFQQAYSFYAQHARTYVPAPEGAESGIWCFVDSRWAAAGPAGVMLELSVPRDQVVLFDSRIWNRMLNLEYIPENQADEDAFEQQLAAMGIRQASEAFSTAFYPTVKQQILSSWKRLFGSAEGIPDTYVQAGLWEIRREWVVSVSAYEG